LLDQKAQEVVANEHHVDDDVNPETPNDVVDK
jgi:hypothetical protein